MPKEIKDETAVKVEDGASINQDTPIPGTEANTDGSSASEESLPFDQHPKWKSARATEKKVNEIMETHDYTNLDDMLNDLAASKQLQDEVGTSDIKTLLEAGDAAQTELAKIKAYWAEQDMLRKKDEDPDEYTALLEKELREIKTSSQKEAESRREQESSNKYLTRYNNEVDSFIEKSDRSEAEKEFLTAALKYDSFLNDTDINSKASVKATISKLNSMMDQMTQSIIERYRDGKIKMPKISSTDTTPTSIKEKPASSFDEAKAQVLELLKKRHG